MTSIKTNRPSLLLLLHAEGGVHHSNTFLQAEREEDRERESETEEREFTDVLLQLKGGVNLKCCLLQLSRLWDLFNHAAVTLEPYFCFQLICRTFFERNQDLRQTTQMIFKTNHAKSVNSSMQHKQRHKAL